MNRYEMFCFIVGALMGIWMVPMIADETTSRFESAWLATGATVLVSIIWIIADVIDKRLTKEKRAGR